MTLIWISAVWISAVCYLLAGIVMVSDTITDYQHTDTLSPVLKGFALVGVLSNIIGLTLMVL
jgi:hypothetical protein